MAALVLVMLQAGSTATAEAQEPTRFDGEIAGAGYTLIRPGGWNGDLVLLVHGSITDTFEQLVPLFTSFGYGVGFVALPDSIGDGEALRRVPIDTRKVQARFTARFGRPARTYLVGFSRGAHAMQRLLESSPARYAGMLSFCGGNGGSQLQWDHFFTARVLFDYYFPGVLPGSATDMPPLSLEEFQVQLAPLIAGAVLNNPEAAASMAAVEQFELPYESPAELVQSIVESLAIHSVAVNDVIDAGNGVPFDNMSVYYTGTSGDAGLNAGVERLSAKPSAKNYLRNWYEPDGSIGGTPVLLVHTARDGIVPEASNNAKYEALVKAGRAGNYLVRRVIDRAGHCTFGPGEIAGAFLDLVIWAEAGIRPQP